jgi:hypothetical protein
MSGLEAVIEHKTERRRGDEEWRPWFLLSQEHCPEHEEADRDVHPRKEVTVGVLSMKLERTYLH